VKRLITFVISVAVLSVLIHAAALYALPRAIMGVAITKIGQGGAQNAFLHPPLPTSNARDVVRPSPDLAYSICIIDVSKGPVHIEVPLTAPYTSVALYAANTDNYFAINDRDTDGKPLDIVMVAKGQPAPDSMPVTATLVEAPGSESLVLVRRVVEHAEDFAAIDEIRQASVCAPL
tara:strand:- start:267232 stop:267759 length:528 start_codon:yes stop_codon:yes gene_type:complete